MPEPFPNGQCYTPCVRSGTALLLWWARKQECWDKQGVLLGWKKWRDSPAHCNIHSFICHLYTTQTETKLVNAVPVKKGLQQQSTSLSRESQNTKCYCIFFICIILSIRPKKPSQCNCSFLQRIWCTLSGFICILQWCGRGNLLLLPAATEMIITPKSPFLYRYPVFPSIFSKLINPQPCIA